MSTQVLVRDLHKNYGSTCAADGVSFDVRSGEIFGLIGPNGAGKTTTIECIIGLRNPDAGEVQVSGIDARREPRKLKERIGAALQTVSLQDRITPREALRLFGAFYPQRLAPDVLLERFGLLEKADAYFGSLSGGQRQRLALALALVNAPDVLVLDEPTTGLDVEVRHELRELIRQLRADGRTVLLTTHDLDEASALCDRVAIIDRGRVIACGSPLELARASTSTTTVTIRLAGPMPAAALDAVAALGIVAEPIGANALRFPATDVTGTLAALLPRLRDAEVEVAELHAERARLEDVLLQLTSASRGRSGAPA